MESCKQDVALIKRALKRRATLIHNKEVPFQKELLNQHGEDLGNIILDQLSYAAKDLMYVNYQHKKPTSNLWIAPETKLEQNVCVSKTHTENIQALAHEAILEIGGHIEKKFETKIRKFLNDAIQENSEFDRYEFEKRIKFAIQCEKNKCAQKIQELTENLKRKFDEEKMEIAVIYEKEYQTKLDTAVNDMNNKLQEILKNEHENCGNTITNQDVDNINKSAATLITVSSTLTDSSKEEDIQNQTRDDIEYCIRQQQNIMQCSNISDVIHLMCTEKLEHHRKTQELERKYCDQINLLKKQFFDICCKIETVNCNCSSLARTAEKECPIALESCQCDKSQVCVKTTHNKIQNPNAMKAAVGGNVKQQCSVCKAKQLCNSLKEHWSLNVSNSGSAQNQETVNLPDFGTPRVGESQNKNNLSTMLVAAVLPEEIGKQIYCDCQSSSSEDCPCIQTNDDQEQLSIFDVQWEKIRQSDDFRLNNDENVLEEVMDTCMVLGSDCKEYLSTITQTQSCNSPILHSDCIQNLMNQLNAPEMVDNIFNSLTKHELQDSEYVKGRFLDELCKRLEQISCNTIPNESKAIMETASRTDTTDSECFQWSCTPDRFRKSNSFENDKTHCSAGSEKLVIQRNNAEHEIWKSFVPLPKYIVPTQAYLNEGFAYNKIARTEECTCTQSATNC